MPITIIAIDPGHTQLGIASVTVDSLKNDLFGPTMKWNTYATVDMNALMNTCKRSECRLHHTSQTIDKWNHFLVQFPHVLTADYIVIENQPPTADSTLQNLLLRELDLVGARNKIRLIQPRTRNRWAGLPEKPSRSSKLRNRDPDFDYRMLRKRLTVELMLKHFPQSWLESSIINGIMDNSINEYKHHDLPLSLDSLTHRVHDRCDALLLTRMFLCTESDEKQLPVVPMRDEQVVSLDHMTFFNQFRR